MDNSNHGKPTYQFEVSGEQGTYKVIFSIAGQTLETSCSCRSARRKKCWHSMYVLAGKTSRITGGTTEDQMRLIHAADKTRNGPDEISKARKKFATETHCRRCNSSRVVKIEYSIIARLFMLFREGRHNYFCKECKWTW